jgi:hypothetical protein
LYIFWIEGSLPTHDENEISTGSVGLSTGPDPAPASEPESDDSPPPPHAAVNSVTATALAASARPRVLLPFFDTRGTPSFITDRPAPSLCVDPKRFASVRPVRLGQRPDAVKDFS